MRRGTSQARAFRAKYGPWALVAGASSGLGAQYATQSAALGLNVALVARRTPELEALATTLRERYGVETRTLVLDLGQEDAAATVDTWARDLDVGLLIYNAAYAPIGHFLDMPLDEHMAELAVNIRTPMTLAWRLGQRFRARGHGGVILMSSLSASFGTGMVSNYAATKAYTLVLAEGLWDELRAQGIDVVAATPAVIAPTAKQSPGSGRQRMPSTTLTPEVVARETLAALGREPSVTPGGALKLAAFFMRRLMPRRAAIRMMGGAMRRMYDASPPPREGA